MTGARPDLKRAIRLAVAALASSMALAAGAGTASTPEDLAPSLDALIRQGDETPDSAIAAIENQSLREAPDTFVHRREILTAIGIVAARNGRTAQALARADALVAMAQPPDPLAEANSHVIRAELEENAGHAQASYEQARIALDRLDALCRPGPAQRPDCGYRTWYRALRLADSGAAGQGNTVVAAGYAQAMVEVARRAGDRAREATALATAALRTQDNDDPAGANRLSAQAQRLARLDGTPWAEVRVGVLTGLLHFRRQQPDQVQQAYEAALKVADAAGMERQSMHLLANLSDVYIRLGRPATALEAIDHALPVARRHNDLRTERLLLHNQTLAYLALGRVTEARAELAHVLELWHRDTGPGERVEALREFGDALAKAGDYAGSIDLFHQEEALAQEISAANRSAAEAELRARYDQDSQKRRIELLGRDNQLKSAELANQALTRRLWTLAGAAMVLMAVLAVLMYLRMRELNRALVRHEAMLRAHSERDALTGLANRRQFHEVMRLSGGEAVFRGALLMVDVDHFKRINDRLGHAAGDRVLVEVARRLNAAMRAGDLVARWGGEEFLVFAPGVDGVELDQLAERVRLAINQTAIALDDGASIHTTVSIGYAAFPLAGSRVPVTWEQAVDLADLSLYTAKNHGRDCAVGIVRAVAATDTALRDIAADLPRARRDGRVTLRITPGALDPLDPLDPPARPTPAPA